MMLPAPAFLLLLAPCLGALQVDEDPILLEAPLFTWTASPVAVEAGNLDGTAGLDVVVADGGAGLAVYLQGRPGLFQTPQLLGSDVGYDEVALGDVDGDADLDLVAASSAAPAELRVFLGDGVGGFQALAGQPLAGAVGELRLADLDGDGLLDAVVALDDLGAIEVRLGLGDGTFAAGTTFPCDAGTSDVVLGDVDGDGQLDAVTANPTGGSIAILRGTGSGGFSAATLRPGLGAPEARLIDLDSDGDLDVVALANTTPRLVHLLNVGGSFQSQPGFQLGAGGRCLEVCDWDGDGIDDVVLGLAGDSNNFGIVSAQVLKGDGLGGLTTIATIGDSSQGDDTIDLAVADVDGDGQDDVLAVLPLRGGVAFYARNGSGVAIEAQRIAFGTNPVALSHGDMNGDGIVDVVAGTIGEDATGGGASLGVSLGAADGSFGTPTTLSGAATDVDLGELTGDGLLDVAYRTAVDQQICIAAGDGAGGISLRDCLNAQIAMADQALGDIDGDGDLDIVAVTNAGDYALIVPNDGQGILQQGGDQVPLAGDPNAIELADLDGDGDVDAAIADGGVPGLVLLWNDGNGNLQQRTDLVVAGTTASTFLFEDFDGDGRRDFILDGIPDALWLRNLGGGVFDAPLPVGGPFPVVFAVGDLNADGRADLIGAATYTLLVALADGRGGFETPFEYAAVSAPLELEVAQLEGDGFGSLILADSVSERVIVHRNQRPTSARVLSRNGSGANPACLTPVGTPLLGSDWTLQVATDPTGPATLSLVVVTDRGLAPLPTPFGELLVGLEPFGVTLTSSLVALASGSAAHPFAIPADPASIGLAPSTQAALVGGGPVLCNALDFVLGDS